MKRQTGSITTNAERFAQGDAITIGFVRSTIFLLVLVVLFTTPLAAQVQSGVAGTVVDPTGTALPGVTIELRDTATNHVRVATTDDAGRFRIANVPPGAYALTASLSGFLNARADVTVTIGQTAHLSLSMRVESVQETVEVTADSSGLDTTSIVPPTVVDTERIEELPVQSRNYLDFVLLAPAVVATPPRTHAHAIAPDSGFSFGGQRARSNVLTIDGLSNNDEYSGAARTELSLETVREFDAVSHGSGAESGGAAGGTINVVTKSGTNVMHGDAFVFAQSGHLDARPFDEPTKPPLERYRTGGAVGGPITRDRTFYYVAGEYESASSKLWPGIAPDVRAAINSTLLQLGSSARLLSDQPSPTGRREVELSAKLNHQLTPASAVVAKIASNNNREDGDAFNDNVLADRTARGSAHTKDVAVTTTLTSILGSRGTNDVRAQIAHRSIETTADGEGAGVEIAGVAAFGPPYGAIADHRQRYLELGDTLLLARGNHLFRAGADLTDIRVTGQQQTGGTYVFRSLDAFTAGNPDAYRQTFGSTAVTIDATRYDAFVQDDWTRGPLTVNAGLRFDAERLPQRLHITNRQLQPRLGLAWAPVNDWILRASAGTFADRIPLVALEKPLAIDGTSAFEQIFDGAAAEDVFMLTRGGLLSSASTTTPRSRYTARRGSWTPSSRQFSLGAEHAFTPLLSASLTLLHTEGHHLLRTVNTAFGGSTEAGDVFEVQPTASSRYTGATLAINRRMADEVEWAASYTISRSTDDASDFDEQPADPLNLAAERAPSLADQRHRVTFSALFELEDEGADAGTKQSWWSGLLRNIEFAPTFIFATGGRANPLTGIDSMSTHAWPLSERPAGYGRNSLRLPSTASLNLRVVKYVPFEPHGRVDFVVEAFNLLNRRNVAELGVYRGVDATPAATFGRPVRYSDARQVQFSLDVEF